MQTNEFGQPVGDGLGDWTPPTEPPELTTLVGQYVTLEPLERTRHAIPLFHAFKRSEPSMWTYMSQGPFQDAAELGQLISQKERDDSVNAFAVVVNNEPLGFLTQMRIQPNNGVLEIGWVSFSTDLQRTRATTEAQYLVLKHAFDSGYRRVEWKCDALNQPSRDAAERLGYTFEGVFKKATHYKGRSRDTAWFATIDAEWPTLHAAFETWLSGDNFDATGAQKKSLSSLTAPVLVARDPALEG